MGPLRLAVIGWGRLGQACAQALHGCSDLVLAGVVRRAPAGALPHGVHAVAHVSELGEVDAALLCVPAEAAPDAACELLRAHRPLVDCASLEGDALARHHEAIAHLANRRRVGAVVGAGWDPGVLPSLQRLFELLVPRGQTRVARRVGAALHHTAAAEAVPGVRAARSSEVHDAAGGAQRYVYVQLERGADPERVRRRIEADPLFAAEPTQVLAVDDVDALEQENRGVLVERLGEGTAGPHASLILEGRFDPAAFSARLMLDAARQLAAHTHRAWRYTPLGLAPLDEAAAHAARRSP